MNSSSLRIFLIAALLSTWAGIARAQLTWTNANGSFALSDSGNWLPASIPVSGSATTLFIATDDALGFDLGTPFTAHGLVINSGITATLAPFSSETLYLGTGGIFNGGNGADFQLPLTALGSQQWTIGTGGFLLEQSLEVKSGVLSISLRTGGRFTFANTSGLNPDWTGALAFLGDIGATSLAVSTFGLSSQNLAQITINGSAAELVDGYLVAAPPNPFSTVPEPSTYGVVASAALAGLVGWRRRRRFCLFVAAKLAASKR